ncbi:hypothetical protein DENIS_0611 [Desulfonema ishimotonii]|uniref:Porin n=1 Tax=Desulfonema ishimotonii TaxID=45657 RepID=A0A401FRU5_9BACT|nr:hypothetical protein [Desulfonema ishimotonii]GBC59670.1 hypothetical protein DENIS_0611 [Desulfonema ishimotonii]
MERFGRLLRMGLLLMALLPLASAVREAGAGGKRSFTEQFAPVEMHGFCEVRAGCRTQKDPHEKDISVTETRLQVDLSTCNDWADFKYKGDVWADGVTEKGEYDTREAWIFSRPTDFTDVKIGRQVLTWGTGELVFLNDLFPKDWQSFFIGRDTEYLKAPSDAAKLSFFTGPVSTDVVYTPRFDPDRYVTGEYISYRNGTEGTLTGRDATAASDKPGRWFRDDEIAVRIYGNVNNYELALYGYRGFWKSPGGETPSGVATFPRLNVYGASARGQLGPGIGNIELAYYQSADDESGSDPLVKNSEMRYLAGYAQDIGKDFNAGLQYYVEQMLDYSGYTAGLESGPARDRHRHVITVQLTKLLMNQNLELSLASYYSPSDEDGYLRPSARYKYTDQLTLEAGANIFFGDEPHTFFGQLEKNTNVYGAIRYDF